MKAAVSSKAGISAKKIGMQRSLGVLALCAAVLAMTACIAAIPIAIKYHKSQNEAVVKADMAVPPEKVYATAVSIAEEKEVKILKKEDEKFYLEATDGRQTASFKAEANDKGMTTVTIVAKLPSEENVTQEQRKEGMKELALRIMNRICDKLSAQCTIVNE
jgi:hypothetical protein